MSGLHANTGAMDTNGRDTVANAEYFDNELRSLSRNVEGLMTIWIGISADSFNKSFEAQRQNMQAFQVLLNDLGESISSAARILNETEEENASAGARLGG